MLAHVGPETEVVSALLDSEIRRAGLTNVEPCGRRITLVRGIGIHVLQTRAGRRARCRGAREGAMSSNGDWRREWMMSGQLLARGAQLIVGALFGPWQLVNHLQMTSDDN